MQSGDKDLEQLIAIAQQKPEEGETELSEVERFVIAHGIKEGEEKVLSFRAWYLYYNWSPAPITIKMFNKGMCKLFKRQQCNRSSYRFFLLNPEPFEGIPKTYTNIRDRMRDERKERTRLNKIKASI